MSFEFNSKIQDLTSKLQGLQQSGRKETEVDDVKDQLRKLNESLQKELLQADKRIARIENRLAKREDASRRESRAIECVWNEREEKVSEIIGGWVEQYQEKAEQARCLLIREEKHYQIRLQEQQQVVAKEMRMQENRVKDLLHVLDKEMTKLNTIKTQNHAAIMKEIASAKQTISEAITSNDRLREERARELEWRISKVKQSIKSRCNLISQDISSKSTKLKHVMKLLLEIQ